LIFLVFIGLEFHDELTTVWILAQKDFVLVDVMSGSVAVESREVLFFNVEVYLDLLYVLKCLFLEELDPQLHLKLMLCVHNLMPIEK